MMLQNTNEKRRYATTSINWKAYFIAFCEKHGKHPVSWKGRLLFADGWRYSSTDYRGPEFPPPTDQRQLQHLKRCYWVQRRFAVRWNIKVLQDRLDNLKEMQEGRDVPLVQTTRFWDEDLKKWTTVNGPVDLQVLQGRLKWLNDDLVLCEQRIRELNPTELVGEPNGTPTEGKRKRTSAGSV